MEQGRTPRRGQLRLLSPGGRHPEGDRDAAPPVVTRERPRVLIVGTGLIGASIGLALRNAGWHVTGVDHSPAAALQARERGAVDDVVGRIADSPHVDIAVVATPPSTVTATVAQVLATGRAAVVTDTASVKGPVVEAVDDPRFVGGHPMAGSDRSGPGAARADLFRGATWIVTPKGHRPEQLRLVRQLIRAVGACELVLDARAHDETVGVVSHLPQVVAYALADLVGRHGQRELLHAVAGNGFRDMTRLAGGDPVLWTDICSNNAPAVIGALDCMLDRLSAVRRALQDEEDLRLLFETARDGVARPRAEVPRAVAAR